jgi:hypothetical protein
LFDLDHPVETAIVPQPAELLTIGLVDDFIRPAWWTDRREIAMVGYGTNYGAQTVAVQQ